MRLHYWKVGLADSQLHRWPSQNGRAPSPCGICVTLIEPLRAELGIDLSGIMKRSRAVLINRFKAGDVDSLDLGGPLLFATALAAVHLLVGGSDCTACFAVPLFLLQAFKSRWNSAAKMGWTLLI